jgi:hypothetical protein
VLLVFSGSNASAQAQDPKEFSPRITATRWILTHGRADSVRSAGIRSRSNPKGEVVPGTAEVIDAINAFPDRKVITLSVNNTGSLFVLRPQLAIRKGPLVNGHPSVSLVDDAQRPTLPGQLVTTAAVLSSGMTLVVAEVPVGGIFGRWLADPQQPKKTLPSWVRFRSGNLYATVDVPAAGIVAGQELVTDKQLEAYDANSVFFEAPAFGTLVVTHGTSGGTTNVTAATLTAGADPTAPGIPKVIARQFGWARPLEMILSEACPPVLLDNGRTKLTIRAEFPNSFERAIWIRWAVLTNNGTVVATVPRLTVRPNPQMLKRTTTFHVVLPAGTRESEMVKIYAVASPGLRTPDAPPGPVPPGPAGGGRSPFLVDAPEQRVGLTTFHSCNCTLEDSLTLPVGKAGPEEPDCVLTRIDYWIDKRIGTNHDGNPRDRSAVKSGQLRTATGTLPVSYSEKWANGHARMNGQITFAFPQAINSRKEGK